MSDKKVRSDISRLYEMPHTAPPLPDVAASSIPAARGITASVRPAAGGGGGAIVDFEGELTEVPMTRQYYARQTVRPAGASLFYEIAPIKQLTLEDGAGNQIVVSFANYVGGWSQD